MFQQALLPPSGRIAGGSDEILRNIIAERVLGLPVRVGAAPRSPVPPPGARRRTTRPGLARRMAAATGCLRTDATGHGAET